VPGSWACRGRGDEGAELAGGGGLRADECRVGALIGQCARTNVVPRRTQLYSPVRKASCGLSGSR
jgi:hypothetical protein